MASRLAHNVSTGVAPLSANLGRKSLRLRARAPMIASAYNYRSGHTGIFRDDFNYRYYHFHVVLSWKNAYGERACAIYGMEKVIEGATFKGNKMVFIDQATTYDPRRQFPREWREEIKANERLLKQLMAAPVSGFNPPFPDFSGA